MGRCSRRRLLGALAGVAVGSAGCEGPGAGRPDLGPDGHPVEHVVETRPELESAFSELGPGDTVRITGEGAPYRTQRWLDVDVDGVSVIGPGLSELVKPDGGANVGGIRIGHHAHCERVRVEGVSYHGNPAGQDDDAKWLHGIVVRDATDVTLEDNYVTRTHPYREHGSGGSGISVEDGARAVRVLNNRVHDVGDRGIQVAGDRVTVSGNIVTRCLDRSISCDLWREGTNYQARNVAIVNNVLGNNEEGSLTGIGGGHPTRTEPGFVTISNNVGFGHHKSFHHTGFDGHIRSVQIEGNVSVQRGDNDIAGISIEIETGTNITIRNNDLYGYSGRGVNVEERISNVTVSGNRLYDPGLAGIRIAGATDGVVSDNAVTGAGRAGVLITRDARGFTVDGNRIDGAGDAGIVIRDGAPGGHAVENNTVRNYGRRGGGRPPALLVRNSDNVVRHNRLFQRGTPAIAESDAAGNNLYDGNWADGSDPWGITDPRSVVRNHTPPFDVHRGVVDDDGDGIVPVRFEKPYHRRPTLTFGRVGGGVGDVAYGTDDAGNFTGAAIEIGTAGGTIDVSVEST